MNGETSEVWAKRIERWKDSGLSTAQFASEIGVNPKTLTFWKWRLKREAKQAAVGSPPVEQPKRKPRAQRFVEVTAASVTEARVEIVLGDGTTIRVVGDVDEESLRRVLSALQARR